MTQKSIGMHHLRPSNPKFFWGRIPRPPTRNHVLLSSYNDPCPSPLEFGITHFSDFFVKTHSYPCYGIFFQKMYRYEKIFIKSYNSFVKEEDQCFKVSKGVLGSRIPAFPVQLHLKFVLPLFIDLELWGSLGIYISVT